MKVTSQTLRAVYFEALVPRAIWRRLVASYGSPEQARLALAHCWAVTIANAATLHVAAINPPGRLGPDSTPLAGKFTAAQKEGGRRYGEPCDSGQPPATPALDGYEVEEQQLPQEMPAADPWKTSWD